MIGLIVLIGIGLYIWLWIWIAYTAKNRSARVAAIVIGVAIPFWDVPLGYYSFARHCSEEGGLKVQEKVVPQTSICTEVHFGLPPQTLFRYGFEIVEYSDKDKVTRFQPDSKAGKPTKVSSLQSRYCLVQRDNQRLPLNIYRQVIAANDLSAGKTAAQHTSFLWFPGWWRYWLPGGEPRACFRAGTDELARLIRTGR